MIFMKHFLIFVIFYDIYLYKIWVCIKCIDKWHIYIFHISYVLWYICYFMWYIFIFYMIYIDLSYISIFSHSTVNLWMRFFFRRNKKHRSLKLDCPNSFSSCHPEIRVKKILKVLKSDESLAGSLVWWNIIHTSWRDKKNLKMLLCLCWPPRSPSVHGESAPIRSPQEMTFLPNAVWGSGWPSTNSACVDLGCANYEHIIWHSTICLKNTSNCALTTDRMMMLELSKRPYPRL